MFYASKVWPSFGEPSYLLGDKVGLILSAASAGMVALSQDIEKKVLDTGYYLALSLMRVA